ncbi:MAG TPA: zinc ribbon domain-containing protein [Chthoniobacterales bacterium]|nr:zinc ribbon domain-containing protein [Chthoniobacterales bacterium]
MSKLICPDCQHQNEPERIYCHNCGARLDRSSLVTEKADAGESEAQTQKHLKKMFDPRRGRSKAVALKFGKVLLWALGTALLVLMILPPIDLPPETKSFELAPLINMELINATSSQQPVTLVYSEEQVNHYLASIVASKSSHAAEGYFPLRRILARFREDACGIEVQRRIFAFSMYAGASYRVRLVNGKILPQNLGGHIGRMPIHPSIMKVADLFLGKAWSTLDRERKSVARLSRIEFHPQSVTLIAGQ